MARKKEPVPATSTKKRAIRLELSEADCKRIERQARKIDRSLSYVARQAVLEWVKAQESEA